MGITEILENTWVKRLVFLVLLVFSIVELQSSIELYNDMKYVSTYLLDLNFSNVNLTSCQPLHKVYRNDSVSCESVEWLDVDEEYFKNNCLPKSMLDDEKNSYFNYENNTNEDIDYTDLTTLIQNKIITTDINGEQLLVQCPALSVDHPFDGCNINYGQLNRLQYCCESFLNNVNWLIVLSAFELVDDLLNGLETLPQYYPKYFSAWVFNVYTDFLIALLLFSLGIWTLTYTSIILGINKKSLGPCPEQIRMVYYIF